MPVAYQPLTPEFTVNQITAGYQAQPAIAALTDGGFVTAWFDYSANPVSSILARRYDRDGNALGSVIQVSVNSPLDNQSMPEVVALDNGGFAVVWQSTHVADNAAQTDIMMRIFSAFGGAVGQPFMVHSPSPTHQNTARVTSLTDGTLLVTWHSYNADQSDLEVMARRFAQNGAPLGNEFLLTGMTEGIQSMASVAPLPGGGFLAVFHHVVFGGTNDYDVYARRFNADGTAGDAFRVNLTTFSHQMRPDIVVFPDGSSIIAWQSHMQSGETDYGIYAVRLDPAGNRIGGEFRIPSITAGEQGEIQLTALPEGGFLAIWQSLGTDGSGYGVYGRYFDAQGNALGDQFALHTYTSNDQFEADAAVLPGGRFATIWESIGGDGDDRGVSARLFDGGRSVVADRSDYNGDHRGDIVLRDNAGWLTSWTGTSTGSLANNGAMSTVNIPANWSVVGSADFNGDGFEDLLLRRSDGYVADWLGHFGGRFTDNGPRTSYLFASDWKVAGTGDFDGDRFDDFLLRRDDGWLTYWRGKSDGVFTSTGTPSLYFTTDWKIASTGDFNGDGYSDILLRRDDGWVTNWLGNSSGSFTNNGANTALFFTLDWSIIGTGDINGDGKDDLILRRDDGWITDWLGTSNGGFSNNGGNTALYLTTDWHISSIADFNGDGREDILLRNDSGWMTNWLGTASGSFANNGANFSTFIAPNWVVQDPFM